MKRDFERKREDDLKKVLSFARSIAEPNWNVSLDEGTGSIIHLGMVNVLLKLSTVEEDEHIVGATGYVCSFTKFKELSIVNMAIKYPLIVNDIFSHDWMLTICHEFAHIRNFQQICIDSNLGDSHDYLVRQFWCGKVKRHETEATDCTQHLSRISLTALNNPHGDRFWKYFLQFLGKAAQTHGEKKVQPRKKVRHHYPFIQSLRHDDRNSRRRYERECKKNSIGMSKAS